MTFANAANNQGSIMNHEKFSEFSKVLARISTSLENLLVAQTQLVEMACTNCDIPIEMKDKMIFDINQLIGVTQSLR